MKTKRNTIMGISSIFGATFFYGFFGILTRSLGYQIPLFFAWLTRLVFSSLVLFLFLYWKNQLKKIKKKDFKWLILRTLAGFVGFIGSYVSFYAIPIGLAYFIFYGGSVAGGYIIGKLFYKEQMTKIKLVSLFISIVGLGLIYFSNLKFDLPLYMLAALISGFGTAIWNTFSKKISGSYPATQLNMLDNFFAIPFAFVASLIIKETWILPQLNLIWLYNLLFALMFIVTGQLIVIGFKHLEAQVASLFMLTEIIFGILLGYIFYREVITMTTVIGGAIILLAMILPELNWKNLLRYQE